MSGIPVDFPNSPSNGELFTNPNNGQTLQYFSGAGWVQYSSPVSQPPLTGTPTSIYVGMEPINPIPGIVWFPTGPLDFGLGYIWVGDKWEIFNAGRVGSGLVSDRPLSPTPGTLFFNTGTQVMEMWDGLAWIGVPTTVDAVDVSFTSGTGLTSTNVKEALDEVDTKVNNLGTSLIYGGTYDASTNLLTSVTPGGVEAGLVNNNSLPTSTPNVFVIVTVSGTGTAPAPVLDLVSGNWLINSGASWELLQLGDPTTTASLVSFAPTAGIGSTNVQEALEEVDSEKANNSITITAGSGLTGGGDLTANRLISLENTGVASGTYGGANQSVILTVDPQGRVTSVSQVSPQLATTFQTGVVQLDNSVSSVSEITAPTSKALKETREAASSAQTQANTNNTSIGNLPSLSTVSKSDLVSSINEVHGDVNLAQSTANQGVADAAAVDAKVGNLSNLSTTNKANTVSAINELDGRVDALGAFTGVSLSEVNATESNLLYVDSESGNDVNAVAGDITKPFETISAAILASVSPNTIVVSEGTYVENNPLYIPEGVQIISKSGTTGYTNTLVKPANSSDDLFVLLGEGSSISSITVETPTSANKAAIRYTGGAGTSGSVTFVGILGTATGSGDGIVNSSSSSGKTISYEIRYRGLDLNDFMKVEGGILATESVHIPNTPLGGGPKNVFVNAPSLGSPVCRMQCISTNSGNPSVQNVAEIAGGTSVFYGVNWFDATNGVHITSNEYDVEVGNGLIDCTTSVLVDLGLTGIDGRLVVSAFMDNSFSYPNTWIGSDFVFEFLTKVDDENVPSKAKVISGADLAVGSYIKPSSSTFGRGPIFKKGMVVLTSDDTATATSDGNNFLDATLEAKSKDSSTFTFQGTGANHCIYFGTTELDQNSIHVKHYGLELNIATGDSKDGKYVFEYWDGVNWVEMGSQSISSKEGFGYSSDHFWRTESNEIVFYGMRPSTPILTKTISGLTAYWVRAKILVSPTSLPQFEQCFLVPQSSVKINNEGIITKLGAAQTAIVTTQGSNIFSENGNVTDYIFTMGSGANAYTHNINNVVLNQIGEGLFWQTAITQGVCTALPLFIEVGYSLELDTTTAPSFDVYLHKIRASGALVADPAGSIVPILRPESLTTPFTGPGSEEPVLLPGVILPYADGNKLHRVRFGPFNITDFYEGDAIALQLMLSNRSTPIADVAVWGVAVIGYSWTDGIRGF